LMLFRFQVVQRNSILYTTLRTKLAICTWWQVPCSIVFSHGTSNPSHTKHCGWCWGFADKQMACSTIVRVLVFIRLLARHSTESSKETTTVSKPYVLTPVLTLWFIFENNFLVTDFYIGDMHDHMTLSCINYLTWPHLRIYRI
jgi:hypothetical protein